MQQEHCQPAARVIETMGGVAAVARIVKRSPIQVRRWRRSRDRGGTDGLVPDQAKVLLIDHARKAGVKLDWNDFLPPGLSP